MSADPAQRGVPRPSLPPLAWAAGALAAGLWIAECAVWRWSAKGGVHAWRIAAGTAVVALFVAVAAWAARRAQTAALCAAGALVGLAVGGLYWTHLSHVQAVVTSTPGSRWVLNVTSDPRQGIYGASSDVCVRTTAGTVAMEASWPKGADPPEAGSVAVVFGAYAAPSDSMRAEQDFRSGSAGSLRVRRVEATAWSPGPVGWAGRLRTWAARRLDAVAGPGGSLLASTLLGDRRRLADSRTDSDMKIAGLAHFEATSGYHLLIVVALLEWLLLSTSTGRRTRSVVVLAATGAFVLVSGARTSVVRGWIMALVSRGGIQTGRRADPVSGLALCVAAMLCASPGALFDLAFQFSVIAVAGVLVFARLVEGWCAAALPVRLRPACGPFAVTICAVTFTLPLAAPAFGFVSTVAPLSNLLAAPLVVVSLVAGVLGLGASALWTSLGNALLNLAGSFCAMLASLAGAFARLPHAAIPASASSAFVVAGLGCATGLWMWWPQPRRGVARGALAVALAVFLVAVTPLPRTGGPCIVVLDVGQGDAILVSDGSHDALVDTGPSGPVLLGALARNHVRAVDEVVVTHLHADHYGGLASLESVMRVPLVYVPRGTLGGRYKVVDAIREASGNDSVRELGVGDRVQVGSLTLDVVSPAEPVVNAATNEASVVMVARRGSESVLLTGDAEEGVLQVAVDAGRLGPVDVLKVGHHGSAISVSPRLLSELTPLTAVISVGAHNRYGHPTPTALGLLRRAGVPTYRTDLDGDVTIYLGGASPRVLGARLRSTHVATQGTARRGADLGAPSQACAKLLSTTPASRPHSETHVSHARRSQARLPHLRVRGPPFDSGGRAPQEARQRRRRSRVQL